MKKHMSMQSGTQNDKKQDPETRVSTRLKPGHHPAGGGTIQHRPILAKGRQGWQM